MPPTRMRVLIWQSRNLPTLPFMLRPIMSFLHAGFAISPRVGTIVVGAGAKRDDAGAFLGNISLLQRGDVFIWVGLSMSQAPWLALGERGVRRILYQTEPAHHCFARRVGKYAVDELWDFAHHNLEACRNEKSAPDAPSTLRYVPPGYLPAIGVNGPEPRGPHPRHQKLFFAGDTENGLKRRACFRQLHALIGPKLDATFSAFKDTAWKATVLSRANIFVNLHSELHAGLTLWTATHALLLAALLAASCPPLSLLVVRRLSPRVIQKAAATRTARWKASAWPCCSTRDIRGWC